METAAMQKRNEKSQNLRVISIGNYYYFVESEEGKIAYRVYFEDENNSSCPCGDAARNAKSTSPAMKCKHIYAVMNCVPDGEHEKAQFMEKRKPRLDPKFITSIENRDFVLFGGLLQLGHEKGLLSIQVEPLQFPTKENDHYAVCKATIMSRFGETYTDIADASRENTHPRVAKHLLRMASTRAIARALRSYTNIPMTCLEELGDISEVIGDEATEKETARKDIQRRPVRSEKRSTPSKVVIDVTPTSVTTAAPEKKESEKDQQSGNGNKATDVKDTKNADGNGNGKGKTKQETVPKISSAQSNAIHNLSRRRGISIEDLEKMSVDAFSVKVEHLSQKDASALIRTLQTSS